MLDTIYIQGHLWINLADMLLLGVYILHRGQFDKVQQLLSLFWSQPKSYQAKHCRHISFIPLTSLHGMDSILHWYEKWCWWWWFYRWDLSTNCSEKIWERNKNNILLAGEKEIINNISITKNHYSKLRQHQQLWLCCFIHGFTSTTASTALSGVPYKQLYKQKCRKVE